MVEEYPMTSLAPTVAAVLRLPPPAQAADNPVPIIVEDLRPAERLAVIAPDAVGLAVVERYGPQPGGETLLAVYNSGKEPVVAKLIVDAAALRLTATQTTGLVSGSDLATDRKADTLTISVPLAADRSEVIRIGP